MSQLLNKYALASSSLVVGGLQIMTRAVGRSNALRRGQATK
jgi:hypothetical protein